METSSLPYCTKCNLLLLYYYENWETIYLCNCDPVNNLIQYEMLEKLKSRCLISHCPECNSELKEWHILGINFLNIAYDLHRSCFSELISEYGLYISNKDLEEELKQIFLDYKL